MIIHSNFLVCQHIICSVLCSTSDLTSFILLIVVYRWITTWWFCKLQILYFLPELCNCGFLSSQNLLMPLPQALLSNSLQILMMSLCTHVDQIIRYKQVLPLSPTSWDIDVCCWACCLFAVVSSTVIFLHSPTFSASWSAFSRSSFFSCLISSCWVRMVSSCFASVSRRSPSILECCSCSSAILCIIQSIHVMYIYHIRSGTTAICANLQQC